MDHKGLSDLYKLLTVYRSTCKDTLKDLGLKSHKGSHQAIQSTHPKVAIIVQHFRDVIQSLGDDTWEHYPQQLPPKGIMAYPTKLNMIPNLVSTSQPRFFTKDMPARCRQGFLDVERLLQDDITAGIQEFPFESCSEDSEGQESSEGVDNTQQAACNTTQHATVQSTSRTSQHHGDQSHNQVRSVGRVRQCTFQSQTPRKRRRPFVQTTLYDSDSDTTDTDEGVLEPVFRAGRSTSEQQSRQCHSSNQQTSGPLSQTAQLHQAARTVSGSSSPLLTVLPQTSSDGSESFSACSLSISSTPISHVYSSEEYVPHFIHRRKCTISGTEYLMHWKYFPDCKHDTWEKGSTLMEDCPELITEFEQSDRCI